MKIWIIGANGLLGSQLLSYLKNKRINVVGTLRHEADVTDLLQLQEFVKMIQPSHIINCAAYTDVDGAEKNSELAFAINAKGAEHVAIVAQDCGARMIHISTDYVFNGKQMVPYREMDDCDPINVYGRSKREGEIKILQVYPQTCIVRTSWLFGAKGKNFISSVLKWLLEKEELNVVSDQCGKPTYCPDLAEAIFHLLDAVGIVHFANGPERSRFHIALDLMQAAKELGCNLKCEKINPVPSVQFPMPAQRPAYTALDTTRYVELTHKHPRSWEAVIKEYLTHAI